MVSSTGTVSATVFPVRKIYDRAFGRCKLAPQQISDEYLEIAGDLLYALLSELATKGLATWCIEKIVLPIYDSELSIPCPPGTVDMLDCNLRTITQLQLGPGCIYTATSGTAANAFDDNLATACIQTEAGGSITVEFPTASQPITFGILPNATGDWDIEINTSDDGTDWLTIYQNSQFEAVAGEWLWVDIEGIPEAGVNYVQLSAAPGTTLNVTEFVCGASPQEIPLAKINRDDYSNLPNKFFPGRPVQFWFDKQQPVPFMRLWPAPQLQFTYAQLVCYIQQHVQDVGSLTNSLAIPQRWVLAIIIELAHQLAGVIPEVDWTDPRIQMLPTEAASLINRAWGSESDGSPTYWKPMITTYTR